MINILLIFLILRLSSDHLFQLWIISEFVVLVQKIRKIHKIPKPWLVEKNSQEGVREQKNVVGSYCSNGCENIEIFDSIWALMVSFWNSSLLHGAIELLKSEFEIQEFWNVHVSTFTGIDNRWSSLRRWNVRFWMFDNATRLPTNVLQPIFTDDSYTILEHACKFCLDWKCHIGGSHIRVSHLVIGLHTLQWPTWTQPYTH